MKQSEKQPYERPTLKRIELKSDEVLVVGCKFQGGSGQIGTNCGIPLSPCSTDGS